jgi:hypothetical protein
MIDPTKLSLPKKGTPKIDAIFAILLLIATLGSAICVYQATRWNGIQAVEFGNSAKFRTESVRAATRGDVQVSIDVDTFTSWANAVSTGDEKQARFLEERFREEFRPAFQAWKAQANQDPGNPIPPGTPFDLPEYQVASLAESSRLEEEATAAFGRAADANTNGDQYILTTVLFAIVLFFCGIYSKWEVQRVRIALLAVALVVFGFAFYNMANLLFQLGLA